MDPYLMDVGRRFATQGFKGVTAQALNEQEREFIKEQYNLQRTHALDDWNRQNEYNHPLEQMNRLRQAGLNPNLVYGKGADNTAASIRSVSPGQWNPKLPSYDFGIGNAILQGAQVNQIKAQTDNIAQQTATAKAQQILTEANTAKTLQDKARSEFDLAQAQELKDQVIMKAKLDNQYLGSQMDLNIKDYELRKFAQEINQAAQMQNAKEGNQRIAESIQRVANMQIERNAMRLQQTLFPQQKLKLEKENQMLDATINNTKTSGSLLQLDKNLREVGINPQDPWYIRMFFRATTNNAEFNKWSDEKYINKTDNQKLYDEYNRRGGLKGTGLTFDQYKNRK